MNWELFLNNIVGYVLFFCLFSIGIFIFTSKSAQRKFFTVKLCCCLGCVLAICFVLATIFSILGQEEYHIASSTVICLGSMATFVICWKYPSTKYFYYIMCALLVWQGGSHIAKLILIAWGEENIWHTLISSLIILLTYVPFWLSVAKNMAEDSAFNPSGLQVAIVFLFVMVIMYSAYLEPIIEAEHLYWYMYYLILEALICYMVIVFQYLGYAQYKKMRLVEYERDIKERRIEQYEYFQSVIDVMNIKCHDLKHQVRNLEKSGDLSPEILEGLKKTVSEYEAFLKTGNAPLDAILTEKKFICLSRDISMTCIIDGAKFAFLSLEDLQSLFGNAVDNAIQYLSTVEEKDCRFLKITTLQSDNYIKLTFENYFNGKVEFDKNGLPISTKNDFIFHGFGTKSLKRIAERYGGMLSFSAENGIFKVSFVFPDR